MSIFKLYYQILSKNLNGIIMYIVIFMGVLLGVIVPNMQKNGEPGFETQQIKYAISDEDNSELSKAFTDYFATQGTIYEMKDFSHEKMQDALYMECDGIMLIHSGFEKAFLEGNSDEYLELVVVQKGVTAPLMETKISKFLNSISLYTSADYSMADAIKNANEVLEKSVSVDVKATTSSVDISGWHYYYKYLAWIFIMIFVGSIAPILNSINSEKVQRRIACSSYKFTRTNFEIFAGVLSTGLIIIAIITLGAMVSFSVQYTPANLLFLTLNLVCYLLFTLSLTFLISKLTSNTGIYSLIANIVGLGMAFLCGIFVPMELLGDSVIKAAHFLPAYWYESVIMELDSGANVHIEKIIQGYGIQLLFAAAIAAVSLVIANKKRVAAGN